LVTAVSTRELNKSQLKRVLIFNESVRRFISIFLLCVFNETDLKAQTHN
jgi:hypothetical protein